MHQPNPDPKQNRMAPYRRTLEEVVTEFETDSTVSLTVSDWLLCVAVSSSVLWLREGSKAVTRMKTR